MLKNEKAMLVSSKKVALDTFELVIETRNARRHATPGQFVHVQIPRRPDFLLRRPISINSVDTSDSTITLIVQAKGEGTKALCALNPGTILDIVGPLGRGFVLHESEKKVIVVGGGIGVAPLRYLIERNPDVNFYSLLGFRSKKHAYQIPIFKEISTLRLNTDDGSAGKRGLVTDTLSKVLKKERFDAIYACGPEPMLKSLKSVISEYDIPCYASLEERMGCGVGACKVCVCKVEQDGQEDYKKVCQDGPVFDLRKVVLD